jgi:hypothetical protein
MGAAMSVVAAGGRGITRGPGVTGRPGITGRLAAGAVVAGRLPATRGATPDAPAKPQPGHGNYRYNDQIFQHLPPARSSSKLQAPKPKQGPNHKSQISNFKQGPSTKQQVPNKRCWSLSLPLSLPLADTPPVNRGPGRTKRARQGYCLVLGVSFFGSCLMLGACHLGFQLGLTAANSSKT